MIIKYFFNTKKFKDSIHRITKFQEFFILIKLKNNNLSIKQVYKLIF